MFMLHSAKQHSLMQHSKAQHAAAQGAMQSSERQRLDAQGHVMHLLDCLQVLTG